MVKEMGRKHFIFYRLFITLCFVLLNNLIAGTHITLSHNSIYDDNILRSYLKQNDWINQTSLYVSQEMLIQATQLRFSYSGDLLLFQNYENRWFNAHKLGIESYLPLTNTFAVKFSGMYDFRHNEQDYQLYDYTGWNLHSELKWKLNQITPVQAGFQYRMKDFKNLSEFSFNEQQVYFQIKHFFPTKTTLIGEINLGIKKYLNHQVLEEYIVVQKNNSSSKGKGYSKRQGKGLLETDTTIVAYNMQIPETHQWSINLKLAQSIFSTTGLSVAYFRYFKPTKANRYLSGQEYLYSKEDELYDDHFSYSNHEWESVLTQLLPWSAQFKCYFIYSIKDYVYQAYQNFDDISRELRKDKQTIFGFSLSKDIVMSRLIKKMQLNFSYLYLINHSNDVYFDFDEQAVTAGIEFNF